MRPYMRPFIFALSTLAAIHISVPANAQDRLADLLADPATDISRPADRARVVAQMSANENTRRQNARAKAAARGLPLRSQMPNGRIQEIADFDGEQPIYFSTQNANAAISTGANLLRTSPYTLSGTGVTVGVWDGGSGRASHQEFGGRLVVMDNSSPIDHATHVGGTIAATGVVASARGMANGATVHSYDWNSDTSEMTARGATVAGEAGKIYLSNHSYGYISGWNYVNDGARVWEWNGSGTSSTSFEDDFGRYNTYARDSDSLAYNAPYYLIFRSAGNERTDNPSAGQNVSLSPGGPVVTYSTSSHPAGDGTYRGGFETIGFNAIGKNVITIGSAADAVTGGVRDPSKAFVSSFSSWGPTDDGRIKPDLVANGDGLYSPLSSNNSAYGTYSGTSMATPNATGSASLLVQQYVNLFPGQAMRASTLKGLLIHTADDRGNAGPDYKYGWGLVNVQAAADLIRDHHDFPLKQRLTENQLTTSITTETQSFVWDGVSPVTATLCWTDPSATAVTSVDSRTPRLINNLNVKIIAPNGSEYLPFVMPFVGTWTQASMDLPATTGVNNTDNIEQVRIGAPPVAGTYQAVVSFSGTLVNSSQKYSLLISGSAAETPPPPPLALSSVSPDNALPGTVTIDLAGTGLRADTAVKLARTGQTDIVATGGQLIGSTFRCQLNLTGAAAGAWDVVATNPDLETSTLPAAFTVNSAIWSESFDGSVTGWTSQATTGSNSWSLVTTQSQSPSTSYFISGPSSKSTTNLTSPVIPIPAGATNLQLKFWQNRNLQPNRDGGRLEFSVDGGSSWFDVEASGSGAAFASNGYNSTINSNTSEFNDLRAWSGNSGGFVETVINLTDTAKYAGKNFRARWRLATNNNMASAGWYVDSIVLLGGVNITNQGPTVTTAASSSSSETVTDPDSTVYQIVRASGADLSVSAGDDGGEPALTYTWSIINNPGHPVFFSTNASNAAQSTTASFEGTGDYQLSVSIRDAQGLTVSSAVNVRVLQAPSGLIVSPPAATLVVGGTQTFAATLLDQFSVAMASQPASFSWSASGGGSIDATGLFTATTAGGPHTISADSDGFSNTASVTVTPAAASVTLGDLNQTYDGSPKAVSVITNPPGLAVSVTYNGSPVIPTDAASYVVEANITDPNYQGSASEMLIVGKATAAISLADLVHTYDGSPKPVTATTTPEGLAVSITYDGSPTPPTNAGSYAVAASVTDPNYQGTASETLVIGKATAAISLANLVQTYDGSPKPVTATTTPEGVAVSITYDGSATPLTNAGNYTIAASVTDSNYQGSASQTLTIEKATAGISLAGLTQTYDGSPKPVTATTTPEGLTVSITYDGSPTPPAAVGTYVIAAVVTDPNYQAVATGSLVISPANDYASWSDTHFSEQEISGGLAADNADADFDQLPNLAEYALGTDPRQFTAPLAATLDPSGLSLTFTRPANLPDVTYAAESSDGLGSWSPVTLELIPPASPSGTETLRANDPLTTGDPSRRFLRLRFGRP
jgi:hypothetical protein